MIDVKHKKMKRKKTTSKIIYIIKIFRYIIKIFVRISTNPAILTQK